MNNPICKAVQDILKCDILGNRIISKYFEVFDNVVHEKSLSRICSSTTASQWTVKYFSNCYNRNKVLLSYLLDICHPLTDNVQNPDIIILLNYYSLATLQAINSNYGQPRTSSNTAKAVVIDETTRTLLCLGGGTLGEIINVTK